MRRKLFVQSSAPFNAAATPFFVTGGFLGNDPQIMISSDGGVIWATKTPAPTTDGGWNGMDYFNSGLFIAIGQTNSGPAPLISTSPDGSTWTPRTPGLLAAGTLNGVNAGGAINVAVGTDGADPVILTSTDGITWTQQVSPLFDGVFYAAAYGSSTYVVCGTKSDQLVGYIASSGDGMSWTSRVPDPDVPFLTSVAYGAAVFVIVGYNGIVTSSDGVTWTQRSIPTTSPPSSINCVRYAAGRFVAVGGRDLSPLEALVLTSTDGITWTEQPLSGTVDRFLYGVDYSAGTWVAVGSNTSTGVNAIYSSLDAVTWTERTPSIVDPSSTLYAVAGR